MRQQVQSFVEASGIATHDAADRGVIPEDHEYCCDRRSTAFREADVILVLGTRMNYIIDRRRAAPNADAAVVRVDIDR